MKSEVDSDKMLTGVGYLYEMHKLHLEEDCDVNVFANLIAVNISSYCKYIGFDVAQLCDVITRIVEKQRGL